MSSDATRHPTYGDLAEPTSRAVRPVLIPLAAAGLLAIGLLVAELQARGILILLFGAALAALGLLVIIRPAIGLAALFATAAVVRVKIGTGTDSPVVASLMVACALLGAWFVHCALNRRPIALLPRSVMIFGGMLVGFASFSMLWGRLVLDPRVTYPTHFYRVQLAALALVVVGVGLLFVGADLLRARSLRSMLVIGIIVIGAVALPFRATETPLPLVNTAGIFGIWFVSICWAHALANDTWPAWLRAVVGALAIGWLGMAIGIEGSWVSGWLPPLAALLVVTTLVRPKAGIVLALLFVVGTAMYYSVFYAMLVTQQVQDGSLGGEFGRIELWRRNLSVIQGQLTFGTGPAGYALYYVTFVPDHAMSTHSNYVDTLAQFGVGGLVGLLGLLASLWRMGWRMHGDVLSATDRAAWAAALGGIPAVALALWLGDWLIPFVYNQTIAGFDHAVYSWLMFAVLCGLWRSRAEAAERNADA